MMYFFGHVTDVMYFTGNIEHYYALEKASAVPENAGAL